MLCDIPGEWFIGVIFPTSYGRGHVSCDDHLAEGVRITYAQLHAEGMKGHIGVVPMTAVQAIDAADWETPF